MQLSVGVIVQTVILILGFHGLSRRIDEVRSENRTGFEGVHGRLDRVNGRVGRLETWRAYEQGHRDGRAGVEREPMEPGTAA